MCCGIYCEVESLSPLWDIVPALLAISHALYIPMRHWTCSFSHYSCLIYSFCLLWCFSFCLAYWPCLLHCRFGFEISFNWPAFWPKPVLRSNSCTVDYNLYTVYNMLTIIILPILYGYVVQLRHFFYILRDNTISLTNKISVKRFLWGESSSEGVWDPGAAAWAGRMRVHGPLPALSLFTVHRAAHANLKRRKNLLRNKQEYSIREGWPSHEPALQHGAN